MQTQAGVVKSIEGKVVAVDSSGAKRELNVGDVVYLGESIVGQDTSSKIARPTATAAAKVQPAPWLLAPGTLGSLSTSNCSPS